MRIISLLFVVISFVQVCAPAYAVKETEENTCPHIDNFMTASMLSFSMTSISDIFTEKALRPYKEKVRREEEARIASQRKFDEMIKKQEEAERERLEKEARKKNTIVLNNHQKKLLAAIIYLEGGNQSKECQLAIGSVVINRVRNGYWGDTLEDVLYAKGQFTPVHKLEKVTPTDVQIEVVEELLTNGTTIPAHVLYFRAWYSFDWATDYTQIDDTFFSYLTKDVK